MNGSLLRAHADDPYNEVDLGLALDAVRVPMHVPNLIDLLL